MKREDFFAPPRTGFFWRVKPTEGFLIVQLLYRLCPPQSRSTDRRRGAPVRAWSVVFCLLFCGSSMATEPPAAPAFADVARAVGAYFASLDDYKPGDLISRAQIDAALASVKAADWEVPDAEKIAQLGLADNSFLVTRLATPAGRKFMRKIAGHPGGYPRLDRLTSISHGQAIVSDLIGRKGGHELIIYLATTKGGHELGQQMAATQQGVGLNQPTGRIYTADDLIAALKRVHVQPRN